MERLMKITPDILEKYAAVLEWALETARGRPYKAYETVLIRYDHDALPLTEALWRRLIARKLHVTPRLLTPPVMEKDFYTLSDKRQRIFIAAGEREFYRALAGNIYIGAPSSLVHLRDIDPKRIVEVSTARKEFREIMEAREAQKKFGWTLCVLPTAELARRAGCSIGAYTEQIVRACFLDTDDPVAKWKEVHTEANEIKRRLGSLKMRSVRIESANMDLTIHIGEQRRFNGVSGHNIPSFEIFTSPDWRGARGIWYANQPSYRSGNLVEKVKLEFTNGRARLIGAHEGEAFTRQMLATDRGAAQIGEFSLTDRRFSNITRFMADTLFDENYGGAEGNCHIALGNAYLDTFAGKSAALTKTERAALGFNESALHWDLVNTEAKTVRAELAGGKSMIIYEKGCFTL
jgi:aminopeptidase